jgi:O-glycosyl hydrolase
MKHLSAFVRPGAWRVEATSWNGHENQLAFVNPDGSAVVVIQNDVQYAGGQGADRAQVVEGVPGSRRTAPRMSML